MLGRKSLRVAVGAAVVGRAGAYLAVTLLTDASLLVRIGILSSRASCRSSSIGSSSAAARPTTGATSPTEGIGDGDSDADESREA